MTRIGMANALTAVLVGLAAVPAMAQAGNELRVAQDGSADHRTISAAIEAAAPGDTIFIAPGTYTENLYIDKPLTLTGDGPREQVVILLDESDLQVVDMVRAWPPGRGVDPQDRPVEPNIVTIHVDDADVSFEHLSIMDESDDLYSSILLDGGTSTVRDIHTVGLVGVRGGASVTIEDSDIERVGTWGIGTRTVATGNEIRDMLFGSGGATGRFEGNSVGRSIAIDDGASFEVVGNRVLSNEIEPGIVIAGSATDATVIGNEVDGGPAGISVEFASDSLVEGNTVTGAEHGLRAIETPSTISGNTLRGVTEVGILVAGQGMVITGNDISGGRVGIHALSITYDGVPPGSRRYDEPPRILDNSVVDASHFALVIEATSPIVSGNRLCAGREAIRIIGDSDPSIGTNDVCGSETE